MRSGSSQTNPTPNPKSKITKIKAKVVRRMGRPPNSSTIEAATSACPKSNPAAAREIRMENNNSQQNMGLVNLQTSQNNGLSNFLLREI